MNLRLAKLADRTPVRLTLALDPDTAAALQDYAAVYQETYGEAERSETLAAAMIEMFLASDAGFRRARKALPTNASKGD
ncbi:MAG: DUF2274 domain-containing protein [Alphaproteobacteria bacterium HGW-Alphaproteobacteria-18]|nr:DUF2274 domain-containing protein [Acidobacteriota bacterium]PKP79765.1 MAG: DUF2274 domain-containing protein [Alphaproteobacteria bacterium HGW-Alphaproteobacteria-18]